MCIAGDGGICGGQNGGVGHVRDGLGGCTKLSGAVNVSHE